MLSNPSTPTVSVVIPTDNSAKTVKQCLESIKKQRLQPVEVIVVDNFSRDSTVKIAADNGAITIQERGTPAYARNIGLGHAKGEYLLFLDSDQTLSPAVIEECARKCKAENAGMISIPEVFVGRAFWATCSAAWKNCYQKTGQARIAGKGIASKPRFFVKEKLIRVGGFNSKLLWGEDYDLYVRLKRAGIKEAFCESKIYHYEDESLRKILRKSIRYGESMPAFEEQTRSRIMPRLLLHSVLTLREVSKSYNRRPSIIAGCALLFCLRAAAQSLGLLARAGIGMG